MPRKEITNIIPIKATQQQRKVLNIADRQVRKEKKLLQNVIDLYDEYVQESCQSAMVLYKCPTEGCKVIMVLTWHEAFVQTMTCDCGRKIAVGVTDHGMDKKGKR